MAQSTIEWTESTWNPVTGYDDASPGCENCYARRMARRLEAMGAYNYRNGFQVTLQPQMLDRPLRWRKPQRIFVNSMSDLFHVDVPKDYVHKVFDVMVAAHWRRFQVLTKRSGRLLKLSSELPWPQNVWMGVSVENADYMRRIDHLRNSGAQVKFLSLEPLIGPLPNLDLRNIDWVIVGGESGPNARPMDPGWVREIRDQCIDAGVAFFSSSGAACSRSAPDGSSTNARGISIRRWRQRELTPSLRDRDTSDTLAPASDTIGQREPEQRAEPNPAARQHSLAE